MAISDIQFRLTGGASNANPNTSLGGTTSSVQLSGTAMNNLFDDVSSAEASSGDTEYRAFSLVQTGATTITQVTFDLSAVTSSTDTDCKFWFEVKTGSPQAAVANARTSPTLGAHGKFQVLDGATERSNTATGGGASTITLDGSANGNDDYYANWMIEITGGTCQGQKRQIASYVGSTKIATVSAAWTTQNPDGTSTFSIYRKVYLGDLAQNDDCRMWAQRIVGAGAANTSNDQMTMRVEGA